MNNYRKAINDLLGISIKDKNGNIIVESKKYNDNVDYQKPIK